LEPCIETVAAESRGSIALPLIIGCIMLDFIFVAGTAAVFLLSIGYAVVCDRL
jgi:hypothetical protein